MSNPTVCIFNDSLVSAIEQGAEHRGIPAPVLRQPPRLSWAEVLFLMPDVGLDSDLEQSPFVY